MSDSAKIKEAWDRINGHLVAIENKVLARYADQAAIVDDAESKD